MFSLILKDSKNCRYNLAQLKRERGHGIGASRIVLVLFSFSEDSSNNIKRKHFHYKVEGWIRSRCGCTEKSLENLCDLRYDQVSPRVSKRMDLIVSFYSNLTKRLYTW